MFFIDKGGYQLLFVLPEMNEEKAHTYLYQHKNDSPWEQMKVLTKTYKAHCFDLSPRGKYSSNLNAFISRGYLFIFENEIDMQAAYTYTLEHRDNAADNVAASIKAKFNCNALKMEQIN